MNRFTLALMFAAMSAAAVIAEPPKRLLLIGQGPDGHPPTTHEYMAGQKIIEKCLKPVAGLEIMTVRADEPWKEGPELIGRSDGDNMLRSGSPRE